MENTKKQLEEILALGWILFNDGRFAKAKRIFEKIFVSKELRQESLEGFYLCCMHLDKFEEAKDVLSRYLSELNEKNKSFLNYAIERTEDLEGSSIQNPLEAVREGLITSRDAAQDLFTNPDLDLETAKEIFKIMSSKGWLDLFTLIDFFQEHGHKEAWRDFFTDSYFQYWEKLFHQQEISSFQCKNIALIMFKFKFYEQSLTWYRRIEPSEDVDRKNGVAKLLELGFK